MLDKLDSASIKRTLTSECTEAKRSTLSPLAGAEELITSLQIPPEKIDDFKNLVAWCMYAKDTWPDESENFKLANPRPRIEVNRVISYIEHEMSCKFDSKSQDKLIHLIETSHPAWIDFTFADQLRKCAANTDAFNQWPVEVRQLLLRTADLTNAILDKANFSEANLQGITIKNTNLFEAAKYRRFKTADFTKANLSHGKFAHLVFNSSKFNSADLSDVEMSNCYLVDTDFSNARLANAHFTNTSFRNSKLIGANLTGAKLTEVYIHGLVAADFTNAKLDNAKFSFASLYASFANGQFHHFDESFNHRNNGGRSILRTIASIHGEYAETKVSLMQQVVDIVEQSFKEDPDLEPQFLAGNLPLAFGDVLLQDPIYVKDSSQINAFVQNRLLPALLKHWNSNLLRSEDVNPSSLRILATYLTAELAKPDETPGFIASHQGAVNQILNACNQQRSSASIEEIASFDQLRDAWHGCPEIHSINQAFTACLDGETGRFFFSGDTAFAYEQDDFAALMIPAADGGPPRWNKVLAFHRDNERVPYENTPVRKVAELLAPHPLLAGLYRADWSKLLTPSLIKASVPDGVYRERFLSAANSNATVGAPNKLVSPEHQEAVGNLFSPYLTEQLELKPEHANTLWQTYQELAPHKRVK